MGPTKFIRTLNDNNRQDKFILRFFLFSQLLTTELIASNEKFIGQ